MTAAAEEAKSALDDAKFAVTAAELALQDFDRSNIAAASASAPASRASRRPASRRNYASLANPDSRPTSQEQQRQELCEAVDAAKEHAKSKDLEHRAALEKESTFSNGKLITKEDFYKHGIDVVHPIFKDYRRLFLDEGGDFKELTVAYYAARILNPLVAFGMSAPAIEAAANELKAFGFDEFRDGNGIIDDMIQEIPRYLALVQGTGEPFWNQVEGASKYDADLAKKAVENPAAYDGKTWKDDPIEKARRVWEWWRAHRADPGITRFVMAARLVALVQVSSASVERTFSQVKLICESSGVTPLEETIICRVFERCNDYRIE